MHSRQVEQALMSAPLLTACVLTGSLFVASPAYAETSRLHGIQFNACDQYHVDIDDDPQCYNNDPKTRTKAILQSVEDFSANVVALQEVCKTTVIELFDQLGPGWTQYFINTRAHPVGCGYAGNNWGIAIFVKGSLSSVTFPPLGADPGGEQRYLLCGNTTIDVGFRACSTHLAQDDTANASQFGIMRNNLNSRVSMGNAVILGADLNDDVIACGAANQYLLATMYFTSYGNGPQNGCGQGSGDFYEADHWKSTGGDGYYDIDTEGPRKVDLAMFNYQRFYADYGGGVGGSYVSDHDVLRAAMTVHD